MIKKISALLILFVISFFAHQCIAQTPYKINSSSGLNVRSYGSTNAKILGSIPNGEIVYVYSIDGSWAKIKYKDGYAYISRNYIKPYNPPTTSKIQTQVQTSTSNEQKINNNISLKSFDIKKYATYNVRWMTFVILALSAILLLIRKNRVDNIPLFGGEYVVNLIVFTLTCCFEFIYLLKMGDCSIWFCTPDEVGWLWTIIGFFVFGGVVYNQLLCFMDIMTDLRYEAGDFDMRLGLYSWIIAIIAGIIAGIAEWEESYIWIIGALVVCQLIQIIIIFINVSSYSGITYAIITSLIYLIGSITTLWILLQFIVLLLIVLIVGLFIIGFLKGGSRSSYSSSSDSDRGELMTESGHSISGTYSGDDKFYGDDGKTYYKNPYGNEWKDSYW